MMKRITLCFARRAIAGIAIALCSAVTLLAPARAAITATLTHTLQATGINSGSSSTGTTVDAPIGSTIIIIAITDNVSQAMTACDDSTANSYSTATISAKTSNITAMGIYYSSNTPNDTPVGTTITCTTNTGQWDLMAVVALSGANGGFDVGLNQLGTTAGTSASIASGTLANASEVLVGCVNLATSNTTMTESAGFTNLNGAGSGSSFMCGYDIVSSTASVTYHPTWTASQRFTSGLASFQASGGGGGSTPKSLPALGVGQLVPANDNELPLLAAVGAR